MTHGKRSINVAIVIIDLNVATSVASKPMEQILTKRILLLSKDQKQNEQLLLWFLYLTC